MTTNEDDYRVYWFSGRGAGGQHRNKHQNCCRVVHLPTGMTAVGQRERSREANLRRAMEVCKARVAALDHREIERFRAGHERIRTYHERDNRVTDHASGLALPYREVLDGDGLASLIEARATAVRTG